MSRSALLEAIAVDNAAAARDILFVEPSLADARTDGGVSLLVAARYLGRHDVLVALASAKGQLDLFEAVALGDEDIVAQLLVDGACADLCGPDGFTAIHLAAYFAYDAILARLLASGADPDVVASNPTSARPLHSAAAGGSARCVELLLDAGADVEARQHGSHTPADVARAAGDVRLMELLAR